MSTSSRSSAWYVGTALAIVLVLAGSWFGFTSSVFAEAGRLHDEAEQAEHQNSLIQARVQALQADFARLDEYRAEIAALQVGIPTHAELSPFIRAVSELADEHGVFVVDIQPASPAIIVPVNPVADEDAGDATSDAPSDGEAEPSPEPPPADGPVAGGTGETRAEAVIEGFAGLPVLFHMMGAEEDVAAFVDSIQTELERLFLVTTIRETGLEDTAAAAGKPELFVGWVEAEIVGYVFVLRDALAADADPDDEQQTLPRPTDRNPFIPIDGSDAPERDDSPTD